MTHLCSWGAVRHKTTELTLLLLCVSTWFIGFFRGLYWTIKNLSQNVPLDFDFVFISSPHQPCANFSGLNSVIIPPCFIFAASLRNNREDVYLAGHTQTDRPRSDAFVICFETRLPWFNFVCVDRAHMVHSVCLCLFSLVCVCVCV